MERDIKSELEDVLAEVLNIKKDEIRKVNSLQELGIESLTLAELLAEIENKFGIDIPNEDTPKILNLGQAVAYIEQKVNNK
ncbi:MAG: acyl carrier protein [Candidatus Saganbacteria bacterium]|uniref:Acyl carrier protein n=1 Tax=Candidatus Saganbacteria bacterium TaxID=2575572 RepID=A0A833L1H8_UNCSA|nr:MAG: acyl carrier protein [Candidatus Saganbacteria bacterium]